jgi:hypothetical protein
MLRHFFRFLGRLYEVFWMLLLTALLSVAAVVTWHFYQQEQFQNQLKRQGRPVTVQIEHTDRKPRAIWDALGNAVYIGFTYQQRPYEARCISDTVWLSEGEPITLLYHPQLDRFGQLQQVQASAQTRVASRLINWTVATKFDQETKALGLFLLIASTLFFVGSGVLVYLTGLTFIRVIARSVLLVGLGAAGVFFTYDTIAYYRYAAQLKRNGQRMEVVVHDTDRHTHGRKTSWHTYDATFRFNNQDRVVAIDEADYNRLNTKDQRLAVRYEAALDDFIAVDYPPRLSQVVMPLFFWLLFVLLIRPTPVRQSAPQPDKQP